MLWLACHFPVFHLEVVARGHPDSTPLAVVQGQRLLALNTAAMDEGVRAGMGVAEAGARCPRLILTPRNPGAERRALRRLADWGLRYSSHVSTRFPDGLLLEIGASLRLFGGLPALLIRIDDDLALLGYAARRAVAPTPEAAWLLALAGNTAPVTFSRQLRARLAGLPCDTLELDARQRSALAGLGLYTLGDCLALPRADLGRRLGRAPLLQLERALGERPDPRRAHRAHPGFRAELPLPAEAHDMDAILFALQRLLRELAALLHSLETGVQELRIHLSHHRRAVTVITVGLQSPSRDVSRLLAVSRERLARQPLEAPVIAVELEAGHFLPLPPAPVALLEEDHPRGDAAHLVERLTARLGTQAVHGLGTAPEHRPERAWQRLPPGHASIRHASHHRPLWLLDRPLPLKEHQGHPCWNGLLMLCEGPERIESGWWDGNDISRDYYKARTPAGTGLWIYRERRTTRHWFLHGFFG